MKKAGTRSVNLVAFIASGVAICAGFFSTLLVVMAFSSPEQVKLHLALIVVAFGTILLIPLNALRTPRIPPDKNSPKPKTVWRRLLARLQRRKSKESSDRNEWKRKGGQTSNQPWGAESTFVPTRKRRNA